LVLPYLPFSLPPSFFFFKCGAGRSVVSCAVPPSSYVSIHVPRTLEYSVIYRRPLDRLDHFHEDNDCPALAGDSFRSSPSARMGLRAGQVVVEDFRARRQCWDATNFLFSPQGYVTRPPLGVVPLSLEPPFFFFSFAAGRRLHSGEGVLPSSALHPKFGGSPLKIHRGACLFFFFQRLESDICFLILVDPRVFPRRCPAIELQVSRRKPGHGCNLRPPPGRANNLFFFNRPRNAFFQPSSYNLLSPLLSFCLGVPITVPIMRLDLPLNPPPLF